MSKNSPGSSGRATLLHDVLRVCRRSRRKTKLSDSTGASLTGVNTLVRAFALRRLLSRDFLAPDERHVGVIMPPTVAGAVVNLALALDRRVPVNLNYVLPPEGLQESIDLAGIRRVITSYKVMERLNLSFEAEIVYLEDLPDRVTRRDKAVAAALGMLTPLPLLERLLRLHEIADDDPFAMLFTSGATGQPKGVLLSHRNVASNCEAIAMRFGIREDDVLIGVLPFFHAFGMTVTLWMPLVSDASVAYHTSPLEPDAIGKLTRERQGTILLATPTLLRLYAYQIPAEDFASLTTVATGAERLPPPIAKGFEEKFGIRPFEGFGVTEASPAIAFNVPANRWRGDGPAPIKEGTVGQPIPGVRIRVTDRDTGEELPPNSEGRLWVSGPNVMLGYLGRPELTSRAIQDGWYNTGDIVRVDNDGFITITGRDSQFSKIAGETVPHLLIEEKIAETLTNAGLEGVQAVVTAVPDLRRGERIIVVHQALPMTPQEMTEQLRAAGLPPLYIPTPDSFMEVESIPMLGTGKVDLRSLNALARARFLEKSSSPPSGMPVAQPS